MQKDKTTDWFKRNNQCKKVVVYQNLKFFLIPSLRYERVNPNHKTLVRGLKKRKYRSGNANYEKVAMLLRQGIPYYLFMFYVVIGWLLMCN